jgi:hypothetical protein
MAALWMAMSPSNVNRSVDYSGGQKETWRSVATCELCDQPLHRRAGRPRLRHGEPRGTATSKRTDDEDGN